MLDRYDREITYLRISLTDKCNLRCKYCMPEEGVALKSHNDILSIEEISEIVKASAQLGIKKIRLTGGEPLLRKGLISLCREITDTPGIEDLAITTNAVLLNSMAEELLDAGVQRLNISLDTLKPERYKEITRIGDLNTALSAIEKVSSMGFKKIKLNNVLLGGFNTDEIRELAELSKKMPLDVRFIELMHMPGTDLPESYYVSSDIVLKELPELEYIGMDGVAKTYRLPRAMGKIGLISPVSCKFCSECNRIRLTADGYIKPCLHSEDEISVKDFHGEELTKVLEKAILSKPKEHEALDFENQSLSARQMNKIGG